MNRGAHNHLAMNPVSPQKPRHSILYWSFLLAMILVLVLSACDSGSVDPAHGELNPRGPSETAPAETTPAEADPVEAQPPESALLINIVLVNSYGYHFNEPREHNYLSAIPMTTLYISGLDPHWPEMHYQFGPFMGGGSSRLVPGPLEHTVSLVLTWYGGGGEELFLAQEEGELRLYRQFLEEISPAMLQSLEADGEEYFPPGPELYFSQALEPGQEVWIGDVQVF